MFSNKDGSNSFTLNCSLLKITLIIWEESLAIEAQRRAVLSDMVVISVRSNPRDLRGTSAMFALCSVSGDHRIVKTSTELLILTSCVTLIQVGHSGQSLRRYSHF